MTGGLEVSHQLIISSEIYPGPVGAVSALRWTPDGCALAVAWSSGGFSLWSTFGALLTCSLSWDYGIHTDVSKNNPLLIHSMVSMIFVFELSDTKIRLSLTLLVLFFSSWKIFILMIEAPNLTLPCWNGTEKSSLIRWSEFCIWNHAEWLIFVSELAKIYRKANTKICCSLF